MEAIQWVIGIVLTILIPIIGFISSRLWAHVADCRNVGERFSAQIAALERDVIYVQELRRLMESIPGINKDVERMKQDIGTHDSGMRGAIHAQADFCQQLEKRLALLELLKKP